MSQRRTIIIAILIFLVGIIGGSLISKKLQGEASSDSVVPVYAEDMSARAPGGLLKVASTNSSSGHFLNRLRPDYELPDFDGNMRTAAEWDGKVVVVNFWATWCAPCRKEIPAFNHLQAKYAEQGVQFVGIALDDLKAVERFVKVIPIEYPILIGDDEAISLIKRYGNVEGALPYTVFVNRAGAITSIAAGGLSESVTENTILKLLK